MGNSVIISTYIHGSSTTDNMLWSALGPLITNREVISDLGWLPVYSVPGMHWFIARDAAVVIGFAALRITDKAVWYDYGYVVPSRRASGYFAALADARDREASNTRAPQRAVIRAARLKHYKSRGWKVTSTRGSWRHILREAP